MFYLTIFRVSNEVYAFKDPGGKIHFIKREPRPGQEYQPSIHYHVDSITVEQQFELLDLLTMSERLDFLISEVDYQLALV